MVQLQSSALTSSEPPSEPVKTTSTSVLSDGDLLDLCAIPDRAAGRISCTSRVGRLEPQTPAHRPTHLLTERALLGPGRAGKMALVRILGTPPSPAGRRCLSVMWSCARVGRPEAAKGPRDYPALDAHGTGSEHLRARGTHLG
jgi:hypothetical protein